jgi:hypothetical protein
MAIIGLQSNKCFLYNRISNIGFFEIGLRIFGLSYNDILCLFNLFSCPNTCIYFQSDLFTLRSLDCEVDSIMGKKNSRWPGWFAALPSPWLAMAS